MRVEERGWLEETVLVVGVVPGIVGREVDGFGGGGGGRRGSEAVVLPLGVCAVADDGGGWRV